MPPANAHQYPEKPWSAPSTIAYVRSPKPVAARIAPGMSSLRVPPLAALLAAAELREPDRDHREREVEVEDPAPRRPLDDRAADRRPDDGRDAREGRPEADRAAGLRRRRRARSSASELVVRNAPPIPCSVRAAISTGPSGAAPAMAEATAKAATPALKAVRRPTRSPTAPREEVERGERQRVAEEEPLLAREPEAEILLDRRHRDDDDGGVDERHRRAEDRRRERQAPPRAEVERLHGRRIRSPG